MEALFSVLDVLELIETATSLLAHGTALPKEQAEADQVMKQSAQAKQEAEWATEDISLAAWTIIIGEAERLRDDDGLYAIDAALTQMREPLEASAKPLEDVANDLYRKAVPIDKASTEQLIRVYLPSLTTVANATAYAMHESLKKLNNTMTAAAATYKEVSELLAWWAARLRELEVLATEAAWDIRVERRALQLELERAKQFRSELPVVESEQERQAREFMKALTDPNALKKGQLSE